MADDPIIKKDDAEQEEVEAQFVDPQTSMLLLGGAWFILQSMLQAICGWLGIQIFKKVWDRIRRWWRKDKDGENERSSDEFFEEESAAASSRPLSG
jgi:hypothetical protein